MSAAMELVCDGTSTCRGIALSDPTLKVKVGLIRQLLTLSTLTYTEAEERVEQGYVQS